MDVGVCVSSDVLLKVGEELGQNEVVGVVEELEVAVKVAQEDDVMDIVVEEQTEAVGESEVDNEFVVVPVEDREGEEEGVVDRV